LRALSDPRVIALSMIYFMSVTANYGVVFFMPQIIKRIGLSNAMTGVVSSVPYIIGTIGLVAWGWSSDRKGERRWHLIVASTLGAAGLVFAGLTGASYWALLGMSAATIGIYGSRADAVDLPHRYSRGRHDRDDQCRRQPWRLCRALGCRLDQGFDRQFPGQRTHHDALEFPNGQIVLLTHLFGAQEAAVLQLPVQHQPPQLKPRLRSEWRTSADTAADAVGGAAELCNRVA
jgi:Major Facilitator Superfamily